MKLVVPKFYKDFKCIGGACTDNCCIGWEIDIDEKTLAKYKSEEGTLGKRLKSNISEDTTPHFILNGERCPFLNSDNLCEIIIERGEKHLCDICREHPRYYTTLGDTVFGGVGLCCEEAARLILTCGDPTELVTCDTDGEHEECDEELLTTVLDLRDEIYKIFGNRTQTIVCTLRKAAQLAEMAQTEVDGEPIKPCGVNDFEDFSKIYSTLKKMEFMTDELMSLLDKAKQKNPVFKNETVNKYLHNAFAYFVHRYLPKAAEDGDILGKMAVITASVLTLSRLFSAEESLTLERAVYLSKLYSKEVEYNEDNIALIEENAESLLQNLF